MRWEEISKSVEGEIDHTTCRRHEISKWKGLAGAKQESQRLTHQCEIIQHRRLRQKILKGGGNRSSKDIEGDREGKGERE